MTRRKEKKIDISLSIDAVSWIVQSLKKNTTIILILMAMKMNTLINFISF